MLGVLLIPTTKLLEKLLEIERSIGRMDNVALRSMLMDAQAQLMGIEKDVIGVLDEMRCMQERQELMPFKPQEGLDGPPVPVPAALAWADEHYRAERQHSAPLACASLPSLYSFERLAG